MATVEKRPNPDMSGESDPADYDIENLALEGAKSIVHDARFQALPRAQQVEQAKTIEGSFRTWYPGAQVKTSDFLPDNRRHY